MNFSSKLLENAVDEMSQLPGIGKRTALRLVLFLLNQPNSQTEKLSKSLVDLVEGVILCKKTRKLMKKSCQNSCMIFEEIFEAKNHPLRLGLERGLPRARSGSCRRCRKHRISAPGPQAPRAC